MKKLSYLISYFPFVGELTVNADNTSNTSDVLQAALIVWTLSVLSETGLHLWRAVPAQKSVYIYTYQT